MIHGGTFFGNLVAFNTTSDSIKTTEGGYLPLGIMEGYYVHPSIVSETGLSFILNNTIAYNNCAEIIQTETETEITGKLTANCDIIGLNNQSFVINNIIYNSSEHGINNNYNFSEMISNNASSLYDGGEFGSAYIADNVTLEGSPFIVVLDNQQLSGGYIGVGANAVWLGYDFAINEQAYSEVTCGGKDIFFDKIPNDMNGISRMNCGRPSMGAFEPLKEDGTALDVVVPTYPQGDVVYVSQNGKGGDDGSSWENAMFSPEHAIIKAA